MNWDLWRSYGRIFACWTCLYFSLCLWIVILCPAFCKLKPKKLKICFCFVLKNLGFFQPWHPELEGQPTRRWLRGEHLAWLIHSRCGPSFGAAQRSSTRMPSRRRCSSRRSTSSIICHRRSRPPGHRRTIVAAILAIHWLLLLPAVEETRRRLMGGPVWRGLAVARSSRLSKLLGRPVFCTAQ